MRTRTLTTIGLGLVLAGCQSPHGKDLPVAAQTASLICAGYGLRGGTPTFETCVAYQDSRAQGQSVPPYRLDQYNNRVDAEGYRVDSMGRRMAVQSLYSLPMGQASSGQTILRDEYGNRYDARGNRI
jgi:hypothetical protein